MFAGDSGPWIGAKVLSCERMPDECGTASCGLIAVVGDTEVAGESVEVTDVAGGFRGSVRAADFIDLVRGAYENRLPHVSWEPAS